MRASTVVKRQSMTAARLLRSVPGGGFLPHDLDGGDAAIEALAVEGAEFDLGNVEPTAMLRGVVDF